MDRDEILSRSQRENRGKDVSDIEVSKNGIRAAWVVTVCLAAVIAVIDAAVFGRPACELLFAVFAGLTVVFAYKYYALRRKHELFVTMCYGVATMGFLTAWIMQIVNR